MAEAKVFEKLKQEVTCPLCLNIFTDPRKLPCDHVYCRVCLHGLALRSSTGRRISCPECRKDALIPSNGVMDFSIPQQVNRLIDIYQESLKSETAVSQLTTCTIHCSQHLDHYCETCEKLICRDCIALSCAKEDHQYDLIDDMLKKNESDLFKEIEPVRHLCKSISSALESITISEKESKDTMEEDIQQVRVKFDNLEEILSEQKKCFESSIKKCFQEQQLLITSKRKELSEILRKLELILHSADAVTSQKEPKPVILANIADYRRDVKDSLNKFQDLSLQPLTLSQMKTETCSLEEFKSFCDSKNYRYTKTDPLKSHIEKSHDLCTLCVHETVEFVVHYIPQQDVFEEKNLKAELLCCHDDSIQSISVKSITSKKFSLCFTPRKQGQHKLHIKHNDAHICGSPIKSFVTTQPSKLEKRASEQIGDVTGIRVYMGKIYGVQSKRGIIVLNSSTLSEEKTIKVTGVTELVIDGLHIFATDAEKHRVVKMDMAGAMIKCTGTLGNAPGQFHLPSGIQLSPDNELYVCDTNNHRIQVFDKDLNFIKVIGKPGSGNDCLNMPKNVDFDKTGNIYIVNHKNHVIQVLSSQGRHIRNIGRPGSEAGELNLPSSAAVHMDMVYITDYGNRRMSVFRTTGEFVSLFGQETLTRPDSIAIDDNGFVYISDGRFKVVKF